MPIADAAVGANNAIMQLLAQRVEAQRYAKAQEQIQFENQRQLGGDKRAQQALDQQGELTRMERDRQAANFQSEDVARKAAATHMANEDAVKSRETFNPGQILPADSNPVQSWQKANVGIGPAIPPMQGRLYTSPTDTTGTPKATPGGPVGYYLGATPTQVKQRAADANVTADNARADKVVTETARHDTAMENKPQSEGGNQLVPEIDPKTGQQTGRFFSYSTKTNSWGIPNGQGPQATKPDPGAAQAAQQAAGKHEALSSLDQLDQAIDAAAPHLGPGMGRMSSIEQMVGNPDRTISALGTKMLLAKMQVDHAASGTVRAGASPAILARWDNILGNNQTPEGLKAAVQAMREILGGGASPAGAQAGPRKRYNPATGRVE